LKHGIQNEKSRLGNSYMMVLQFLSSMYTFLLKPKLKLYTVEKKKAKTPSYKSMHVM
jgi:hypothetical protein